MVGLVPKVSEATLADRALIGPCASMNAFVDVHVELLRKNFSTNPTLVTHGMLQKSPCLLFQAREVNLTNFDPFSKLATLC